jgi:hypothetical protein
MLAGRSISPSTPSMASGLSRGTTVAGYLVGRLWFAERKREIQDEVDDEVAYRRARRSDTGLVDSFRAKNPHSLNAGRKWRRGVNLPPVSIGYTVPSMLETTRRPSTCR